MGYVFGILMLASIAFINEGGDDGFHLRLVEVNTDMSVSFIKS